MFLSRQINILEKKVFPPEIDGFKFYCVDNIAKLVLLNAASF